MVKMVQLAPQVLLEELVLPEHLVKMG